MREPDVRLTVDGVTTVLAATPATSLLRALRDAGLVATKGACEQGECGSCSVLLDGDLVCSCLVPALTLEGADVLTVRGLLAPDLADALAGNGAVQCGFCTPGFVVAIEALLRSSAAREVPLTLDEAREALAGNLCRCTGYEGLLAAVVETDAARRAR